MNLRVDDKRADEIAREAEEYRVCGSWYDYEGIEDLLVDRATMLAEIATLKNELKLLHQVRDKKNIKSKKMAAVKPLEWHRHDTNKWGFDCHASTAHGYYIISSKDTGGYYVGMCRETWENYAHPEPHFCKTLYEAKVWAEQQHEKEMRKWIE